MSAIKIAFIGAAAWLLIGVGFMWRGEQPATPTEIAKAIATLNKVEKQRFAIATRAMDRSLAYPEGRLLTYGDLKKAVYYAQDHSDEKAVQVQEEALKQALQPGNAT